MSPGTVPSRAGPPRRRGRSPSDSSGRVLTVLLVVTLVLGLVSVGGWYLADRYGLVPALSSTEVTIGISLTPDTTGTLVAVVVEAADDSLPSTLSLSLARTDDAHVSAGKPTTGKPLLYSDVQDGFGITPPADQIRAAELKDVRTDGRRFELRYHVRTVDDRRVVYPIPASDQFTWQRAQLFVSGGTATCWGNTPGAAEPEAKTFVPCATTDTALIDGTQHSQIRVELTTVPTP